MRSLCHQVRAFWGSAPATRLAHGRDRAGEPVAAADRGDGAEGGRGSALPVVVCAPAARYPGGRDDTCVVEGSGDGGDSANVGGYVRLPVAVPTPAPGGSGG